MTVTDQKLWTTGGVKSNFIKDITKIELKGWAERMMRTLHFISSYICLCVDVHLRIIDVHICFMS